MNNLYSTSKYRGNKKKFDFKAKKDNTVNSLKEIEYFLNNINIFLKYFKLYKILK